MSKILLVEDNQFLSTLLKNRLEKEQFEVLTAHNGYDALDILRKEKPDLILLDIILPGKQDGENFLPGKTGFEVLEEMRADPQLMDKQNIPVIIISNLGQESDMDRGKELGVVDYFVKARVSIDDLVGKVRGFIPKKD